jgi:predicted nucleic acid-binding protein
MVSLIKYRRLENWKKHARRLINGKLFKIDSAYEFDPDGLAWKLVMKEENIGMVDAIEIEHCLNNGEELVTFDKKQEEVWRKLDKRDKS